MAQQTEQEIRLQFLAEAEEYLDTIETFLVGLANRGIDGKGVDGALRAAHSIKGGAAVMGFATLSEGAHRIEDGFKVLKARRRSLTVDMDLETLLLQAVDQLRQVSAHYGQGDSADPPWFAAQVSPTFEQIRARLGDPQAEDINAILAEEEGTDIAPVLFESEVEGVLDRLAGVINDPQQPCLREELVIIAQELAGLGQMLELSPFVQLCEAVNQAVQTQSEPLGAIAQRALQTWRRSQALVLVGQIDLLPNQLDSLDPQADTPAEITIAPPMAVTSDLPSLDVAPVEALGDLDLSSFPSLLDQGEGTNGEAVDIDSLPDQLDSLGSGSQEDMTSDLPSLDVPSVEALGDLDLSSVASLLGQGGETSGETVDWDSLEASLTVGMPEPDTRHPVVAPNPISPPAAENQSAATVPELMARVPFKLLEQLDDLFSELILGRNALNLYLDQMGQFSNILRQRLQTLEEANRQLRTFYDRLATEGPGYPWIGNLGSTLGFDILEQDQYSDLHLLTQTQMETIVQIREVTDDLGLSLTDADQVTGKINQTVKQLQSKVTKARMRPLSDIVGRYPRAVRDLEAQYGKAVDLKLYGQSTLMDRTILEILKDPLTHLLRNAFDHGIEPPAMRAAAGKPARGLIEIRGFHRGNQTIIIVRDDGAGINLDKVRDRARGLGLDEVQLAAAQEADLLDLIFEPGFSTASQVTTLSGRGVGMDVVRTNLQRVRGEVQVQTQPGQGTTFTITVPLTLSILRILLVESNGLVMAVPVDAIATMIQIQEAQRITIGDQDSLNWNGITIPLVRLADWLKFSSLQRGAPPLSNPTIQDPTVLLIQVGENWQGIQVDRCWGDQEVAIRPVEGAIALPPGFAGCTILGDGRVVPLVDIPALLAWIGDPHQQTYHQVQPQPPSLTLATGSSRGILVVDDSINVRRFLASTLERSGYQVFQARDGQDAMEQLRGGLPVQAVVCDIEMPRLDGYGVLAEMQADPHLKQIPVTMLTSRSGDKHRSLAMSLGAAAYFSKPYNKQELLEKLEQLMASASIPVVV